MSTRTLPTNAEDVTLADLEAVGSWERDRVADLRAQLGTGFAGLVAESIVADLLDVHYGKFTRDDVWSLIDQAAGR